MTQWRKQTGVWSPTEFEAAGNTTIFISSYLTQCFFRLHWAFPLDSKCFGRDLGN